MPRGENAEDSTGFCSGDSWFAIGLKIGALGEMKERGGVNSNDAARALLLL